MTTGTGYRRTLQERAPLGPDPQPPVSDSKRTALIVDDDPTIGRLLIFYLREAGFTPLYAPDGLQALTLAARHKLSLVLLDVMLPGLNGLEVCRELRQMSNVPIIMLTSKSSDYDISTGLSAGADDYIAKPFNGQQLLAQIEHLMSTRAAGAERPGAPEPQLASPAPTPAGLPQQAAEPQPAASSRRRTSAPLPGTQLRRARRTAQLSLPQVEHTTGIRWDYLQALEQDELALIPRQLQQPILTRYARFLGLDPDPLWSQHVASGRRRLIHERSIGALPALVIACALVALLVLLVALYAGAI
jgi:DNA-binding response OmpR family regulator